MSLTQKELISKMDVQELVGWLAFDLSTNTEFKTKVEYDREMERQANFTAEQEAEAIKTLFRGICGEQ